MPLTAKEVIEYSTALLAETQQTRDDAERFEKVHGGYLLPRLPPDLARDEAVYVLAYDVMHEAREIKSRIMTFEEEIQCLPTSRTTSHTIPEQDKAATDKLERAGAIFLSRLDPNLRLKAAVTDRQLVEPLAIAVLELGAIDKDASLGGPSRSRSTAAAGWRRTAYRPCSAAPTRITSLRSRRKWRTGAT